MLVFLKHADAWMHRMGTFECVVFFFLSDSSAFEFYVPTFWNIKL